MHVLEDENRRRARSELIPQRRDHLTRPALGDHQRLKLSADALGDVKQGAERPRRKQRVARAPQHTRPARAFIAEPPHERRLAHPGVTPNQHQPSRRTHADRAQRSVQRLQLSRTLEHLTGVVEYVANLSSSRS